MAMSPLIGEWIDNHAPTMNILGLRPGCRVGYVVFAVDVVAVASARRALYLYLKPAICLGQHGDGLAVFQFNADIKRVWRPQGKTRVLRVQHDCAVGPGFQSP